MTTKIPDEAPPTEEPKDEPPEHTSPKEEPPAVETAKEEGEKVPEWGKTLIDQVSGLTEAITGFVGAPSPDGGITEPDSAPTPKPWHKKGM